MQAFPQLLFNTYMQYIFFLAGLNKSSKLNDKIYLL